MVSKLDTFSAISRSMSYGQQNRLHIDTSTSVAENKFPIYNLTGDVEIIIRAGGHTSRYLLHRFILAQCSGFFEASTTENWTKQSTENITRQGTCKKTHILKNSDGSSQEPERKIWRYELEMGDHCQDIPVLVRKDIYELGVLLGTTEDSPPPVYNKPIPNDPCHSYIHSTSTFSHSSPLSRLSKEATDFLQAYENLFRTFYNQPPSLHPTSLSRAYHESKALLSLAEIYDALSVIGPRIDHHLLRFQSTLWKQIAKYPTSYLRLGFLAQSKHIFQEALVHIIGQWPNGEGFILERLPTSIVSLIQDKARQLQELVTSVETALWRLTLRTSSGARVTPYNSYLDWLVVSFFREWLVECVTQASPMTGTAPALRLRDRNNPSDITSRRRDTRITSLAEDDEIPALAQEFNEQSIYHDALSSPSIYSTTHFKLSASVPSSISPKVLLKIGRSNPSSPSYLRHNECKSFLKLTSDSLYTHDNLKYFERRLEELRSMAREAVKPIMLSKLNDKLTSNDYLVCVGLEAGEWPWDRRQ
ncbi:BgTH12-03019 [Blumeria graminis f. sp. triticale]|uniref:Bgt-3637 n=2 Tax=Blumeria graminis TaxID=34373 RepID=A0A9X9MJ22_BLUGR|nr:BgTH12-03019 [Blumeria graminis f. sp. triticale]VDB89393.1 Bgt-3637 [Blumeria graminis f. sp. tritici]